MSLQARSRAFCAKEKMRKEEKQMQQKIQKLIPNIAFVAQRKKSRQMKAVISATRKEITTHWIENQET